MATKKKKTSRTSTKQHAATSSHVSDRYCPDCGAALDGEPLRTCVRCGKCYRLLPLGESMQMTRV